MSLFVFTVNATVSCFFRSTQCNSRVWPEAGCVIVQWEEVILVAVVSKHQTSSGILPTCQNKIISVNKGMRLLCVLHEEACDEESVHLDLNLCRTKSDCEWKIRREDDLQSDIIYTAPTHNNSHLCTVR